MTLVGDLDLSTSHKLVAYTINQIRPRTTTVTLDFAGLSWCDSAGMNALLEILGTCEASGRQLRLVRLPAHVRALLDRAGVSERLHLPSEERSEKC